MSQPDLLTRYLLTKPYTVCEEKSYGTSVRRARPRGQHVTMPGPGAMPIGLYASTAACMGS